MVGARRRFLKTLAFGAAATTTLAPSYPLSALSGAGPRRGRQIRVALVQFDTVPEQIDRNVSEMEKWTTQAAAKGARWVVFHENSLCDYTRKVQQLAEPIPNGSATRRMAALAQRLRCYISFGLPEKQRGMYHIAQAFVGPRGGVYQYRKTWLWHGSDVGYRDEWARYDPGVGPEAFEIDGVRATCFICADGLAERCIERAAELRPQVVFYPNNRETLPQPEVFGKLAKTIGGVMLVTNRVGPSWVFHTQGGCAIFSPRGVALAEANRQGRPELLIHTIQL